MWDTCTSYFGPKKFDWVGRGGQRRSKYGPEMSLAISRNPLTSRFWAFGFSIYTSSSANFKKDPPWNIFFLSLHAPATCVLLLNESNMLRWTWSPPSFEQCLGTLSTRCLRPTDQRWRLGERQAVAQRDIFVTQITAKYSTALNC